MDRQRRLVLPKPWRLSTDKIAKVAKEGEKASAESEVPVSADELTHFYLMPWVVEGLNVIYCFDRDEMARFSAPWNSLSPFSKGTMSPYMNYVSRVQVITLDSQWRFQLNNDLTNFAKLDPMKKDGVVFLGCWHWGVLRNADGWDPNAPVDDLSIDFIGNNAAEQQARQEKLEDAAVGHGAFPPGFSMK